MINHFLICCDESIFFLFSTGHSVILFNASPKLEVIAAVGGRHYVKGAASQWALGLESQDLSILPKCSCL